MNGCNGSFAEINDTPKAAVRAAPIEGEADLAIQQKRPFASGKFQETTKELERKVFGRFFALVVAGTSAQAASFGKFLKNFSQFWAKRQHRYM